LGQADVMAEAHVALARLRLAQGDAQGAGEHLERADRMAQLVSIDPWITCWADQCRVQRWLSIGDLEAAVRWAEESGLGADDPLRYQYDLHHINLARVWAACARERGADPEAALRLLARLLDAAERAGWVHEQIKVLVLQALTLDAHGQGVGAEAALARALGLAEPGGYVRAFLDEGPSMARLLHRASSRAASSRAASARGAYVERLLAAFSAPPVGAAEAGAPAAEPSPLVEPLSEREIEVLEQIAAGRTNREIGETLVISLGTVKAHTANIYGKMGVHSRTHAVARARELGLLDGA
jgi:LuxR family maltose regulon positive regulatory protein